MKSRFPNFKAKTLTGFALAIGFLGLSTPSKSLASGITTGTAYYRLTSNQDIAAPPADSTAPQVIATVLPPGSIVPPTQSDGSQISPLTILNTSSGFDSNQLIVALKDNAADATAGTLASQLFGLSFFGTGFTASGGHLDFALNIDNTLKTPPVLQSMTPGITIISIPDPTLPTPPVSAVNSTPNAPSLPNVITPEPMSLTLWSAVLGLGLVRARKVRSRALLAQSAG